MKSLRIMISLLALVVLALPAHGQGQTGITGVVKDTEGGLLPGVTVTVKNTATGQTRVAVTSSEGRFSVPSLPPGTYEVTAQLQNFADYRLTDLRLVVGTTASVNVTLSPAGVEKTVTVTGERTIIETTESDVSTAIPEELIENVPVAERNAISLALLVPGVGASPYFDPTKSRDNFDGVSFGGGSGSENLILVDGGDNNDDVVGSILQFYPQESIQEFEVITSRFKAEYGHTDGGVVNMITKSGSNSFSGGAYWLVRDDNLNRRTFVEQDVFDDCIAAGGSESSCPEKPPFNQDVLGAYLGGPIVQDKAFFFGNYDYTTRDKSLVTTTGGGVPEVDAQGAVPQPFTQKLLVGKVTANLTDDNFFTGRYAYQDDSTENLNLDNNDSIAHAGFATNTYHAFLVKDQMVLGGDKLNEVFYQFNRFTNGITSNAAGTALDAKEINISGPGIALGNNINHPQATTQDKHQLVDNFSWRSSWQGDHDLKAGFEFQRVKTGGFFTLNRPFATFEYLTADSFRSGARADSVTITNGPGFFVGDSTNNIFALYLQDDWKPTQRLTLNMGLRYDIETNDWTQKTRRFISADPIFFGAQPETDKNNLGPRIGFAYDVEGTGNFVLRGGYGLYYQQIFWNSPIRVLFDKGELQTSLFFPNDEAGVTFGPDDPFCTAGAPAPGCIPVPEVPGPLAGNFVGGIFTSADPNLKTPYSHQFSAGMSIKLPWEIGFDADYAHSRSDNQIYRARISGQQTINGLPTGNMGVRATINTQGGEQRYNGLLISARKRAGDLTAQVSYTFARGEGHFARQTDRVVYDSAELFDQNFGPGFGQRDHLFAASIFYKLPYDLQVGTILKFQSGFAFDGVDPALGDLDGDARSGDTLADEALGSPMGSGHRGDFRGDSFSQVDLRVSKQFVLAGKYRPQVFFEVFNLFNTRNEKPNADAISNLVRDPVKLTLNEDFGRVNDVAGQPFQAQLSVRFDF